MLSSPNKQKATQKRKEKREQDEYTAKDEYTANLEVIVLFKEQLGRRKSGLPIPSIQNSRGRNVGSVVNDC